MPRMRRGIVGFVALRPVVPSADSLRLVMWYSTLSRRQSKTSVSLKKNKDVSLAQVGDTVPAGAEDCLTRREFHCDHIILRPIQERRLLFQ